MRFVHTADWHLGKSLNDYPLLEDQRDWFSRFCARLAELAPDALVVAGDLYDRSVPSGEAVSLCDEILSRIVLELKIPTLIIAGNHDSRERLSFASGLLERSGLYLAGAVTRDIRRVRIAGEPPVDFYLLPYFEPHNVKMLYPEETVRGMEEALRLLCGGLPGELDPEAASVLVGHGLFSWKGGGVPDDCEVSVGGAELCDISLFEPFDYCAFGHLHSARSAGRDTMRYSGSPLKYSVDEARQKKSVTLVTVEGKGRVSFAAEAIPPLRDVRLLAGELAELAAQPPAVGREDYVFAELADRETVLNAMARLKAVYPNILGLKYTNLRAAGADELAREKTALAHKTNLELFEGFYQAVAEEPLTPPQAAYAAEIFAADAREPD